VTPHHGLHDEHIDWYALTYLLEHNWGCAHVCNWSEGLGTFVDMIVGMTAACIACATARAKLE
jgi:hypothetical protein